CRFQTETLPTSRAAERCYNPRRDGGMCAMLKRLTEAQCEEYDRDGVCFPVHVATAAEAAGLRANLEAAEAQLRGPITGILRHKSHLLWPWLADLVRRPAILDAVADLIGPDILVWGSTL